MKNSKYSKFLTILLIVIIIVIVGLLGFFGFDMYQKYFADKDAKDFVENFQNEVVGNDQTGEEAPEEPDEEVENPLDKIEQTPSEGNGSSSKPTYKGFESLGTIEIPKTGVALPVLKEFSRKAIATAVAVQYGPGLNVQGNTVIAGHNYRNGQFFSNNKKLAIGDAIYITDNSGTKIKYVIYNKYETTPEDTDYMLRDTKGGKEISLTTCTDDSKARIIIWAKEEK